MAAGLRAVRNVLSARTVDFGANWESSLGAKIWSFGCVFQSLVIVSLRRYLLCFLINRSVVFSDVWQTFAVARTDIVGCKISLHVKAMSANASNP